MSPQMLLQQGSNEERFATTLALMGFVIGMKPQVGCKSSCKTLL